jgi:hypothetical protein
MEEEGKARREGECVWCEITSDGSYESSGWWGKREIARGRDMTRKAKFRQDRGCRDGTPKLAI